MKKFLVIVVIGVFGFSTGSRILAQAVPNGGMETWITTGNYVNPQGWDSPNQESSSIPIVGASVVTKSSGAHSGSWCAKLESKSVVVATVPGIMTLGQLSIDLASATFTLTGGTPISTRPTSVKGFYKYTPAGGGDTAAVVALFTKHNTSGGNDTIGIGFFMDGTTVTSWTAFDAPVYWFNLENPDTMNIIVACTSSLSGVAGSVMYVDDMVLDYSTGITDALMAERPNVYLNSIAGTVEIFLDLESSKEVSVNMYNLNGQKVRSAYYGATSLLNKSIGVNGLKTGMYFVEILSGTERIVQKITIF